jgi:hypothetical protein
MGFRENDQEGLVEAAGVESYRGIENTELIEN